MDFINDNSGRHLLKLAQVEVPDYVKEAALADEDIARLPNGAFADPSHREFPIETKGHAFLSFAYIKSSGINNKAILSAVERAVELHGIKEDLSILNNLFDAEIKAASAPEAKFAVTLDFGPGDATGLTKAAKVGGLQGFYPINTREQINASAMKLAKDWSNKTIPMEVFVSGSREIVKQARELKIEQDLVPKSVWEYGEEYLPDFEFIKAQAIKRAALTQDESYNDIASAAEEAFSKGEDMLKFADLWYQTDGLNNVQTGKSANLMRHMDAYCIFNSGENKLARDKQLEGWVLLAGRPVPVQEIAAVKEAEVKKHFAKNIGEQVLNLIKEAAQKTGSQLDEAISGLEFGLQKTLLRILTGV